MKKDELFTILDTVAKGVAETFGPNCETLIQDLTTLSHPILAIYNSQVTGRSVGSTTSIKDGAPAEYALELSRLQSPHINMLAAEDNRHMKSTTMPFFAEDGVLGLGINFDYTAFEQAEQAIKALTAFNGFLYEKPLAQLTRQERLTLLGRLKSNHFFEQHKAMPYLAEQLAVSRHTLYKDLKALEG